MARGRRPPFNKAPHYSTLNPQLSIRRVIKLLSTDFDGTLVNHFATPGVSPALFAGFAELQARGCLWAVNTGRELHHIVEGLVEFEFHIQPDFVLTAEREVFQRAPDGTWQDFGDWNKRCLAAHTALFDQSAQLLQDIAVFLETVPGAQAIQMGGRMIGLVTLNDADMDLRVRFSRAGARPRAGLSVHAQHHLRALLP